MKKAVLTVLCSLLLSILVGCADGKGSGHFKGFGLETGYDYDHTQNQSVQKKE